MNSSPPIKIVNRSLPRTGTGKDYQLTIFTTKRLSIRDNLSYISTRTLVRGDSSALKRNKYLSGLDEYSRTVYQLNRSKELYLLLYDVRKNCLVNALFAKEYLPFAGLVKIGRLSDLDHLSSEANELVQVERLSVQVEILHDFSMMHVRWKLLRNWKIREAHHLLARVDNCRPIDRAVAFFFGEIPQAPDRVFFFETDGLQAIIVARFDAG
ncbi:hypothetical protein P5673_000294 [Acropora cervicornis]|uniref:Uncharacterized protein n=1 Tax=Acropora cervicornis TaxID=6130 RepID=A0AAD9VH13_ACRCE|nr:hypothetical protein P5673_000294 [Acropora cervicornis]